MPAEYSYHHSVSCLVRRQVVTILSFYYRAELLVRLARFPLFCWRYFFSSQDVFRTFSQNEVLIIVFGFLELFFRPLLFVICTGVTLFALVLQLNCTALSQSESSNFFHECY